MLPRCQGCQEIGGDWQPSVGRDRSPERSGEGSDPHESLRKREQTQVSPGPGQFLPAPGSPPGCRGSGSSQPRPPAACGLPLAFSSFQKSASPPRRRRAEPRTRRAAFPRRARRSVRGTAGPSRRAANTAVGLRVLDTHGRFAGLSLTVPMLQMRKLSRYGAVRRLVPAENQGGAANSWASGSRALICTWAAGWLSFADPHTRGDASVRCHWWTQPGIAGPVRPECLASLLF